MLVLLVVSLALNLCFIAGAVWTRMRAPPTAAERFQQMGNELNLNAEQRERFQNYVRTMRTRSQSMREETEPLIAAAWADAAKPQPDEPKIARAFDQAADAHRLLDKVMKVRLIAGHKARATIDGAGVLEVTVNPPLGLGGRPSSELIIQVAETGR